MNYGKLSLEELEELFLQQREHHYALTEAVRNSRDALADIMNAVNDKRKGNGGASFDSEIEMMFQSIHRSKFASEFVSDAMSLPAVEWQKEWA
jgi:hypothetical protein